MGDINKLISKIKEFNKERDWEQFHNVKDLVIAFNFVDKKNNLNQ